jgi:hypothetical protein
MAGTHHRSAWQRTDDARLFGQRAAEHHDGNGERAAGELERIQRIRLCEWVRQRVEHRDLPDQRSGDHHDERQSDVHEQFQWDVHASDGEQPEWELRCTDDSECAELHTVSDPEHFFHWLRASSG